MIKEVPALLMALSAKGLINHVNTHLGRAHMRMDTQSKVWKIGR